MFLYKYDRSQNSLEEDNIYTMIHSYRVVLTVLQKTHKAVKAQQNC